MAIVIRPSVRHVVALVAVAIVLMAGARRSSLAVSAAREKGDFAIVGGMAEIGPGQTARLNVANIALGGSDAARPPCSLELSLVDKEGVTQARLAVSVEPGRAESLEVPADQISRDSLSTHIQIRPVVLVPEAAFNQKGACDALLPSLEYIREGGDVIVVPFFTEFYRPVEGRVGIAPHF